MAIASDLYTRREHSARFISSVVLDITVNHIKTFAILGACQVVAYAVFRAPLRLFPASLDGSDDLSLCFNLFNGSYHPADHQETDAFATIISCVWCLQTALTEAPMMSLLLICVRAIRSISYLFITSLFEGAFVRACGEICACKTPRWKECLAVGRKKMFDMVCYKLLLLLMLGGAAATWICGVILPQQLSGRLFFGLTLLPLVFFAAVFSCKMVGAKSAIMIENKSVTESMKRSSDLCRGNLLFNVCCSGTFMFFVHVACYAIRPFLGSLVSSALSATVTKILPLNSM